MARWNDSVEESWAASAICGETDASRVATVFPIVELGSWLAVTHLDGARDENLVMDAPTFAASSSPNPGFIRFNMFLRLTANLIALRAHHAGAQLVKYAEGCLIARQAKLPLKLDGRHSRRLTGDQVSRPEPR